MLVLPELFALQAQQTPDRIAVVCSGKQVTYQQLDSKSNRLAQHLRELGVQPGVLVGLCVDRSVEMLIGLFGIMKAGGAYVPIDPAYPGDRIAYMLEDSNASVIVTENALVHTLPEHRAQLVCLDGPWDDGAGTNDTPLPQPAGLDELAYLIYTSGSTGRPKGVEIPHRSLANFLTSMQQEPGLTAKDRLLAVTTLSFDIAGLELYLPLIVGATLVLATRIVAADGRLLADAIVEQNISVMQATPATWRLLLEADWQGSVELRIFCGGETLARELAEQLLPRCAELWNLYGPTETTIWSTAQRVASGTGSVPIGHPIANTQIYLLDESRSPVADGEPGELYIGGAGLARGYFNLPELTAERFVSDPFAAAPQARMYRTGDLAKIGPGGSLEHLGRVDLQVKVRGFRIELGEIEATLEHFELVRQAVVLAREDVPGDKRLVAYVIPALNETPTTRQLRERIAARLPDYMIPGVYVFLDEFPLTPNGKVDRNALPEPDTSRPELSEQYVAPSSQAEIRLAGIFAEVLRLDSVGTTDDFFELGGDSLKVAQVATRIREIFDVDIPLRKMFDSPTVAGLLPQIEAAESSTERGAELPISSITRGEQIPLSFAQQRVWFLHQVNPENLAYNFQSSIRLGGVLDVDALERTLNEVVRRHEAYRSTFPMVDGQPVQIVQPASHFPLPFIDLADKSETEQQAAMQAWCDKEFQLRFDLTRLPLVRWTLLRLAEQEHILIHMEHHLVHDGWSFNVFLHELVELYSAFTAGEESPLPALPVQFAEFATWQREWMQDAVSERQLAYWKEQFATIPPVLNMPTKDARPPTQTFRGASLRPEIPLALCNDLRALSREQGTTLFMTMLAGFMALLHRYTSEPDIAIGTFFANRRSRESESLIGMILNNVVIRASLAENPTVHEFITQVRNLVLEGADCQDVPFDRVVETVQPVRDLSYNPLFQVMFSFHDEPMPEQPMLGLDVKVTPVLSNGSAKFDLGVIGIPHSAQQLGLPQGSEQDGLTMIWEHNTDLFDTSTIARMIEHYKSLLAAMVADPQQRISKLEICSADELADLRSSRDATRTGFPVDACLHDLITRQAQATPDAVAVVDDDTQLTYRDLDLRSNQLARALRNRGVEAGVLVGICVERSAQMLVGLLGILKAGGAYVPVDPAFPKDRQVFMLEDANISLVVSETALADQLSTQAATTICLDSDAASIDRESDQPLDDVGVRPEDPAYVIYTSGSTGLPKGVRVPHRAIVNFLCSMQKRPGLSESDHLFAVTTLSFDIAGLELYLPLTVGARVIIGARSVVTNGEALARRLEETSATVMQATPATWRLLIESGWRGSKQFTALCGGEALPRPLAEQLLERVGTLWNMYGPSETTIWSTVYKVVSGTGLVPIGTPIDNTEIYLIDTYDNLVPTGVVGELCIGGAGVALGYHQRAELTRESFVDNPLDAGATSKLYRTGDLARYREDGSLLCLGRIDHQIKLRGFRIELGEIETLLTEIEPVREAVVVVREYAAGDERLVAYVVLAPDVTITGNDILAELRRKLPEYMVPSMCVVLDALPQTPNKKIDRTALPDPAANATKEVETYVAPREAFEASLKEIWEQILGVSPVGVRDDFFDLGGHSLLAVRLVSEIQAQTGRPISLAQFLQARTIESVARVMGGDDLEAADFSDRSWSPFAALKRLFGR